MTEYTKYYRKHYSKYYNHEAIKRHMIEKQIYSPSDFRYYSYQLSHALNGDTTKSDETLHNLETKYIQDSIDFLFNDKTNNNRFPYLDIDQFNIFEILNKLDFTNLVDKTQISNISAAFQPNLLDDDNNVSNNVSINVSTSKEITKKLLNLLSEEQLQNLLGLMN